MPDLELSVPARVTIWHVRPGQTVVHGDRLIEISAGPVSVDLPAPTSGVLSETRVAEDAAVVAGQVLGIIAPTPEG